jgi:hypothetical protein
MRPVGPYLLLWALLSCLVVGKAAAGFYDGNALSERCESPIAGNESWCLGYVAGVYDAVDNPLTGGSANAGKVCMPESVKMGQLEDSVKLWLREHPEKRHLEASFLVLQALKEKFPCN